MSAQSAELDWHIRAEFIVAPQAEQLTAAALQIAAAVEDLHLTPARLEQIVQATVEAIRQARMQGSDTELLVRVSIAAQPDACASGCWGFFLVARTSDRLSGAARASRTTIELFLYQEYSAPP